jgi:hypothetical protein
MVTREELQELISGVADLEVISGVLNQAVSGVSVQEEFNIDDLKPTGQLKDLVIRIKENQIIDNNDLDRLLEIANQNIEKNSRFNSLFVMISSLAKTIKTNVLPLIVK